MSSAGNTKSQNGMEPIGARASFTFPFLQFSGVNKALIYRLVHCI